MVVVIKLNPLQEEHLRNEVESELRPVTHDGCVEIKVDLFKGARSLGIEVANIKVSSKEEHEKPQILITNISEGGLVGSDGRIKIGDWLVAVKQYLQNGDTFTYHFDNNDASIDVGEVKQILRRCKGNLELFVVRDIKHTYIEPSLFTDSKSEEGIVYSMSKVRSTSENEKPGFCSNPDLHSIFESVNATHSSGNNFANARSSLTGVHFKKWRNNKEVSTCWEINSEPTTYDPYISTNEYVTGRFRVLKTQ